MGTFVVWICDVFEPGFATVETIVGEGEFVAFGIWSVGGESV